jgi:A/G-specific adenine glycosylase
VPSEVSALLSLPGIGRYSAGAIASIAFDQPTPIVDGNVIRLLCRFFGLAGDPTRAPLKNEIWRLAEQLIPPKKARDFNQALMEMGATCCTPKQPLCAKCPLAARCRAHQTNAVTRFPQLPARSKVSHERHVALLAEKKGAFLLEQQPTHAPRWAGLWQFPHGKVAPKQAPLSVALALARAAQLQISKPERRISLKHTITRYRIALEAFHCRVSTSAKGEKPMDRSLRWVRPEELLRYALPAPHAKIARALLLASDKAGA